MEKELTKYQQRLKELTKIWIDTVDAREDRIAFRQISDLLFKQIKKFFYLNYQNNGNWNELANDVLLDIYNRKGADVCNDETEEKSFLHILKTTNEYPNLQNYALMVARNKINSKTKELNTQKRVFDEIAYHNKHNVGNDMSEFVDTICYEYKQYKRQEYLEFEMPLEQKLDAECKHREYEVLVEKIKERFNLLLKERKNRKKEAKSISIFIKLLNGVNIDDILDEFKMKNTKENIRQIQHIFYRYKQIIKNEFADNYNKINLKYLN